MSSENKWPLESTKGLDDQLSSRRRPSDDDCPLLAELVDFAWFSAAPEKCEASAEQQEKVRQLVEPHLGKCLLCQRRVTAQKRAIEVYGDEMIHSLSVEKGEMHPEAIQAFSSATTEFLATESSVADMPAAIVPSSADEMVVAQGTRGLVTIGHPLSTVPARGISKLTSFYAWSPLQQAACIMLILGIGMGAGGGIVLSVLDQLGISRKAAFMDTYVEHPERNPVYVQQRTIVAEEMAKAGVIDLVRMTVSTLEGEEIWSDEKDIRGEFGEAVPFRLEYEAPTDGQILMVKVEYIPVEAARAADPESMRAERLTHITRAACLPKGVLAYFSPGLPPEFVGQVDHIDQRWVLKLRTRTSTGYVTIGVKIGGAGEYVILPPQPVSKEGQELTFDIIPGDVELFTAVPFASETGTAEELVSNIKELKLHTVEQGESRTAYTHLLARFVDPPQQVQGVNHVLQIEVSSQLLRQRDVWVGVKPVQASDQIWRQVAPLTSEKSRQHIYLGVDGNVNEKFEVLILSVPRGTFQSDGPFRSRDVEELGVEILASTLVHRTE